MYRHDVAIVGGGPCGLLSALLLARAGIRCLILEKKAELSTHPKAMGTSRRTAEIYRQLGLLDRILDGSLQTEDECSLAIWAKSLVGEELGRVPLVEQHSDLTPCFPIHCPQTWTEKVLCEAIQRESCVDLRMGTQVTGVTSTGDGATLSLGDGDTVSVPWVIAADGAGSGVRHLLQIETDGPGDMGHFINVLFRASYGQYLKDRRALLYQALDTGYFEAFVSVDGDERWLMHHFLQPGEKVEDYTKERCAELIVHASGLPEEKVEVLNLSPWVMSPKVARQFRHQRIFLVGDAAARLSPAGGLGLNTGMQSAHNLAWKLAMVIKGQAAEGLLDTYTEERRGVSLLTMGNTNHNAEEIIATVTAGWEGRWDDVRKLVAGSRRGGSNLGQDLGIRYDIGAFLPDGSAAPLSEDPINAYRPEARPGERAPHLLIMIEGRPSSILDFFGSGFVLLAGREVDQWGSFDEGRVCRNQWDFLCEEFESAYGISQTGAVLVRPYGYVAARFHEAPTTPNHTLKDTLAKILHR